MNNTFWQITILHPDYCSDPQIFLITTEQLNEMTRNPEFSEMIEGSGVLGGLIGAVESIQDQTL